MHSFSYKGVDFTSLRCYVVGDVFQRMPQPRVNQHDFAQGDGGVTQGVSFGMRNIRLQIRMTALDETERESNMAGLLTQLVKSQGEGPGDLQIDMFPGKLYTNAKLVSDVTASVRATMEDYTLEFVCDPWPVAVDIEEEDDLTMNNGVVTTVTGATQVVVQSTWTIRNTSGSPAAGVSLQNSRAAGSITWGNELPAGAHLKLNSELATAEISLDSGATWTSVPANMTGTIPQMYPGANDVTLTGLTGKLDVAYRPGYTL